MSIILIMRLKNKIIQSPNTYFNSYTLVSNSDPLPLFIFSVNDLPSLPVTVTELPEPWHCKPII